MKTDKWNPFKVVKVVETIQVTTDFGNDLDAGYDNPGDEVVQFIIDSGAYSAKPNYQALISKGEKLDLPLEFYLEDAVTFEQTLLAAFANYDSLATFITGLAFEFGAAKDQGEEENA